MEGGEGSNGVPPNGRIGIVKIATMIIKMRVEAVVRVVKLVPVKVLGRILALDHRVLRHTQGTYTKRAASVSLDPRVHPSVCGHMTLGSNVKQLS